MMIKGRYSLSRTVSAAVWLLPCLWFCGCMGRFARITSVRDAIPVTFLPSHLIAEPRGGKIPFDFCLLSQRSPATHIISPGDTLGIYLQGLEGASQDEAATALSLTVNNAASISRGSINSSEPVAVVLSGSRSNAYPVTGLIHAPLVGLPLIVSDDGTITLPIIGRLSLERLTLSQAAEAIRRAYTVDRNIFQPGQDRTIVTLIKPRVHRIIVIRDDLDSNSLPSYYSRGLVPFTKLGNSIVLDLPAYENDVLHALVASGGLPGIDAENEILVLRGSPRPAVAAVDSTQSSSSIPKSQDRRTSILRIPLLVSPSELTTFSEQDMILEDGDILHVRAREAECFYTGGLLAGQRIPLPRDRDIDVIEAIAVATGSPGGYPGDSITPLFRSSNGAGGIIKPTRVIVVRRLRDGEQIKISVDLNRAALHTEDRLVVQADDFILLEYKPSEFVGNAALGLLRVGFLFVNTQNANNAAATTTTQNNQNSNPEPTDGGGVGGTNP